jgi:hypothetical protein
MAPPTAAPSPVGGEAPPDLDLVALAASVCARYYAEFPDEDAVYGEVGRLWCQHDLQHLLNWAALDVAGTVVLDDQVAWLARILESRRFPILRLARSLEPPTWSSRSSDRPRSRWPPRSRWRRR